MAGRSARGVAGSCFAFDDITASDGGAVYRKVRLLIAPVGADRLVVSCDLLLPAAKGKRILTLTPVHARCERYVQHRPTRNILNVRLLTMDHRENRRVNWLAVLGIVVLLSGIAWFMTRTLRLAKDTAQEAHARQSVKALNE